MTDQEIAAISDMTRKYEYVEAELHTFHQALQQIANEPNITGRYAQQIAISVLNSLNLLNAHLKKDAK